MKRIMIVADDFGLSKEINGGIETGVKAGALSFASLMVDGKFAADAVRIARENPGLTVGLHVDVSRLLGIDEDVWRGVRVNNLMEVISGKSLTDKFIEDCQRQITKFFELGFAPTFINSHFNIHILPQFFPYFVEIAADSSFKYVRFSKLTPLLFHPDIPIEGRLSGMAKLLEKMGMVHSDEYIAASFHFFPPELKQDVTEIMVHLKDSPGSKNDPISTVYYLDLIKILSWGDYYRYVRYRGQYEELNISGAVR